MEERVRKDAKVYEPKRKKPKANANSKAKPAQTPAGTSSASAPKPKGAPKPGKAKPVPPVSPTSQPEDEVVTVGAPAEHHEQEVVTPVG
jgi:hypothetical protein